MKNLFTILVLIVFTFNTNAQDSNLYFGASFGASTLNNDDLTSNGDHFGLGGAFGLNAGYRFNENFGITVNLGSSSNSLNDSNTKDLTFSVSTLSIGPMFSMPLGDNLIWDFKPQISLMSTGKLSGEDPENTYFLYNIEGTEFLGSPSDEWTWSGGPTWVIGNSLVFKVSDNVSVSLDADYVLARFTELDDPVFEDVIDGANDILEDYDLELKVNRELEVDFNSFRFGVGVRYNF